MQRNKTKSIRFNFIMNLILTASSVIFPLITYPYVSRVLGVEMNGRLAFATATITNFSMFASLGIPTYGIRACAQVRDNKIELSKTVHELLGINLIATTATYVAFFAALVTVPTFQEEKELLLINSISLILNSIGVSWLYSALEKYSYITIRSIIFKIISVILMFAFVHKTGDYIVYAFITVFAAGGSNIMNFINMRKHVYIKPIGGYNVKRHIKPILFFLGSAVASSVYTSLDMVMLRFLSDSTQVGYYQAAVKIKTLLVTLVTSLGAVLMPRLSYYVKNNAKKEFQELTVKAINFVLIVASSMVIYFILFAPETILLLSGEEYLNAVMPMRIIMSSVMFIGASYVTGLQILIPMGKEKNMLISHLIASIINLISNFILIPIFKASGAAFSSTGAEFCVIVIQIIFLWKFIKPLLKKISFIKTFIALIFATIGVLITKEIVYNYMNLHTLFILIITAIVFFGLYLLMLLILKETFAIEVVTPIVKKIFKNSKSENT